jgi:hypothetical protein
MRYQASFSESGSNQIGGPFSFSLWTSGQLLVIEKCKGRKAVGHEIY